MSTYKTSFQLLPNILDFFFLFVNPARFSQKSSTTQIFEAVTPQNVLDLVFEKFRNFQNFLTQNSLELQKKNI